MSLASLCSHIHKSTYNDCKPETQRPEKSTAPHLTALLASHQRVALQPAPPMHIHLRQQTYACIALGSLQN